MQLSSTLKLFPSYGRNSSYTDEKGTLNHHVHKHTPGYLHNFSCHKVTDYSEWQVIISN